MFLFRKIVFNPNLVGLFLGVRFEVEEGVKLPRLKLVTITPETSNLARKTYTYVILENIPFSNKAFLILLMSAFVLQKISVFRQK